jgi:hypothetical protein
MKESKEQGLLNKRQGPLDLLNGEGYTLEQPNLDYRVI